MTTCTCVHRVATYELQFGGCAIHARKLGHDGRPLSTRSHDPLDPPEGFLSQVYAEGRFLVCAECYGVFFQHEVASGEDGASPQTPNQG